MEPEAATSRQEMKTKAPAKQVIIESGFEVRMKCPDQLKFIESRRRMKMVVIDDFIMSKNKTKGRSTHFFCCKSNCNAGLTVYDFKEEEGSYSHFRLKDVPHNHEPCPEEIVQRENNPRPKGFTIINKKTGKVLSEADVKALEKEVLGRKTQRQESTIEVAEEPQWKQLDGEAMKVEAPPSPMDMYDFGEDSEGEIPSPPSSPMDPIRVNFRECLICSTDFQDVSMTFPMIEGRTSSGSRECWSMFLLRGIFCLANKECGKLIDKSTEVVDSDPLGWFKICSACFGTVEKVYRLNETMMSMEKDIISLQHEIEKTLKANSGQRNAAGAQDKTVRARHLLRATLNAHEIEENRSKVRKILEDRLGINESEEKLNSSEFNRENTSYQFEHGDNDIKPSIGSEGAVMEEGSEWTSNNCYGERDFNFLPDQDDSMDDYDESDYYEDEEKTKVHRTTRSATRSKINLIRILPNNGEACECSSNEDDDRDDDKDPAYKPTPTNSQSSSRPRRSKYLSTSKIQVPKSEQIKLKYKVKAKQAASKPPPTKTARKVILMQCTICPHRFVSDRDRLQHKVDHDTLTEFVCQKCSTPLASDKGLKMHMVQMHNAEPAPRMKCERCNFTTSHMFQLTRHMETHRIRDLILRNPDGGGYSCKICTEVFRSSSNVYSHLGERHKDELGLATFVCDICGVCKLTELGLSTHIKQVHLKIRDHVCDECGKGYTSKNHLAVHKWTHKPPGQNKVMCEICGLEYANPKGLRRHTKLYHENATSNDNAKKSRKSKHECPFCGVNVIHERAIYIHMKTCHAELHQFECDQCEARFSKEVNLKNHKIGVHSKEQFPCPNCDSVFKCEDYLRRHVRDHCRNNPQSKYCKRTAVLGLKK